LGNFFHILPTKIFPVFSSLEKYYFSQQAGAHFFKMGMIFVILEIYYLHFPFHSQISIIMSTLAYIGIAIQAIPVFFIIKTSINMIKNKTLY